MDKYCTKRHPGLEGGVYSGNGYAEFVISGTKVNSNIAWLSPKIDMDTYKGNTISGQLSTI
jgi:hypothetical protein